MDTPGFKLNYEAKYMFCDLEVIRVFGSLLEEIPDAASKLEGSDRECLSFSAHSGGAMFHVFSSPL